MRSASRQALAAAKESLTAQSGSLTVAVGAELLSVSRVIGSSAQLAAALSDQSADVARKEQLVAGVFGTTLSPTAAGLLAGIVASSWSAPADLVEGIEQTGIRVIAVASGQGSPIQNELLDFGRVVTSNPDLELALGSKLGDPAAKSTLVTSLLGNTANEGTVAILAHLVAAPRGRRIGTLVLDAANAVADQFGTVVASVSVASTLDEAQVATLTAKLNEIFDASVVVNQHVDASLIGGIRVRVGDRIIDSSVAKRLQDLRLQLVG